MKQLSRLHPPPPFAASTAAERRRCDALNHRLRELEASLFARVLALDAELARRLADPTDVLASYTIELTIDFHVGEHLKVPERGRVDDRIAHIELRLEGITGRPELDLGFGALHSHHGEPGVDITDAPHCWTYRELYDDPNLDVHDLTQIHEIRASVQVREVVLQRIEVSVHRSAN